MAKDALGWRCKFAVVAPSTNTIVQPDMDSLRVDGVTNHFGRIFVPNMRVGNDDDFVALVEAIGATLYDAVDRCMTCEPDYLVIRDCLFLNNTADINLPDVDACLIESNRFMDVTAAITMTSGDHNQIIGNIIEGAGAGVNNMINLTLGTNNVVGGNYLTCTIAQYDTTCSDTNSGSWGGNECANGPTAAAPT